jgi:hypothetical protein
MYFCVYYLCLINGIVIDLKITVSANLLNSSDFEGWRWSNLPLALGQH